MTSRSYFGKMNSILGSGVPLAMFMYKNQMHVFRKYCSLPNESPLLSDYLFRLVYRNSFVYGLFQPINASIFAQLLLLWQRELHRRDSFLQLHLALRQFPVQLHLGTP